MNIEHTNLESYGDMKRKSVLNLVPWANLRVSF